MTLKHAVSKDTCHFVFAADPEFLARPRNYGRSQYWHKFFSRTERSVFYSFQTVFFDPWENLFCLPKRFWLLWEGQRKNQRFRSCTKMSIYVRRFKHVFAILVLEGFCYQYLPFLHFFPRDFFSASLIIHPKILNIPPPHGDWKPKKFRLCGHSMFFKKTRSGNKKRILYKNAF